MGGGANDTREREDADALEEVRIFLSWVPPDHAKAAFTAFNEVDAQIQRLRSEVEYQTERAAILASAVGMARLQLGEASRETTALFDRMIAAGSRNATFRSDG